MLSEWIVGASEGRFHIRTGFGLLPSPVGHPPVRLCLLLTYLIVVAVMAKSTATKGLGTCQDCGNFLPVRIDANGDAKPISGTCPTCDGDNFIPVDSETVDTESS
jgi:hypothetical protein